MVRLRYKTYSLNCGVNQFDDGNLSGLMQSADFILAKNHLDIAIANTCNSAVA